MLYEGISDGGVGVLGRGGGSSRRTSPGSAGSATLASPCSPLVVSSGSSPSRSPPTYSHFPSSQYWTPNCEQRRSHRHKRQILLITCEVAVDDIEGSRIERHRIFHFLSTPGAQPKAARSICVGLVFFFISGQGYLIGISTGVGPRNRHLS